MVGSVCSLTDIPSSVALTCGIDAVQSSSERARTAIPSWLLEPVWDQFAALLPNRPVYDPSHPLGCRRPRIADRIIFEKLIQILRFGCSYASIADNTCGATTIRERRNEWIKAGIFTKLKKIAPGILRPHGRTRPGGTRR